MEVGMSLRLSRPPVPSPAWTSVPDHGVSRAVTLSSGVGPRRRSMVVEAKGRKGGMRYGQNMQRSNSMPVLPKLEDDGLPKFVIFVRAANINYWYPLSMVSGGSTAKALLAVKDNFLGKYVFKDALDKNLAAVIYNDEEAIKKTATEQHRELRGTEEFRYGYKTVENFNLRAAMTPSKVIELPTRDQLLTVADKVVNKVKELFEDAKKSFRMIVDPKAAKAEAKKKKLPKFLLERKKSKSKSKAKSEA